MTEEALRTQLDELQAKVDELMSENHALKAENEAIKAENDTLKNRRTASISLKVSEKGALSVYGLGRFPVTLYKEQWGKLLGMADDIRKFIAENNDKLKTKEESAPKS